MMTITVQGGIYNKSDEFWSHIETMCKACGVEPTASLTRISRDDNQANYRAPGSYTLEFIGYETWIVKLELK